MPNKKAIKVIVVLSPGRSGTSLLMKALVAMGMNLSESVIPGSEGNPEGFFEDAEIVEVHKELLQNLNTNSVLPLPVDWLNSKPAIQAKHKLQKIIENRLQESSGIWGFKDPRTASFLPLWIRILNSPGIVPVFILAIRDPANVAASMKRQIGRKEVITELQWLQRTTNALYHTAANCYIVHFEDWFTRPVELAQGLLEYTELNQYFSSNLEDALKDVIKPNLHRAFYYDYTVQNDYVIRLYEALKACRGTDFDRKKLSVVVKESRKIMNSFKGWYVEAQNYLRRRLKHTDMEKLVLENDRLLKENKDYFEQMEKLVLNNNHLLKENKDYFEQIENLRKHFYSIQNKRERYKASKQIKISTSNIDALQKEIHKLRSSYSYRLGQVFVSAIARPGKNTFMLPFRFIKIVFEFLFARK
jgi:hypothetical protein